MLVSYYQTRILLDAGEDWKGKLNEYHPQAILITHAHPDHAGGLAGGAPCPVYATHTGWQGIDDLVGEFNAPEKLTIQPRVLIEIGDLQIEAFPVDHSTRDPAVGYRLTAGSVKIFYVPDVVWIHERGAALDGIHIYIGDGATMTQSLVRKVGESLVGHTPVRTQLSWCQKEGVPRAIFTHCGFDIVNGEERKLNSELQQLAESRQVEAQIAYDGMELVLR